MSCNRNDCFEIVVFAGIFVFGDFFLFLFFFLVNGVFYFFFVFSLRASFFCFLGVLFFFACIEYCCWSLNNSNDGSLYITGGGSGGLFNKRNFFLLGQ